MELRNLSKKIFFTSIGLLIYFSLAFTGLIGKIDFAIVGAIYEFITIPLILLVIAIVLFALFQFMIKRRANFYLLASSIVNMLIIILMFSLG